MKSWNKRAVYQNINGDYTLPTWAEAEAVAEQAGGHAPDPVRGAVVFSRVMWNSRNGTVWETPVINPENTWTIWKRGIFQLALIGTGRTSADGIAEAIAAYVCENWQGGRGCPYTALGTPNCKGNAENCGVVAKIKRLMKG